MTEVKGDKKDLAPVPTRTPEEVAAAVKKATAEAAATEATALRRAEAEARKAEADALLAEASARKATAEARTAELVATKAELDTAQANAKDEFHHVYRFDSEVANTSVKNCMSKLSEWSRLDPHCEMEIVFSSPGGNIIWGMALFDFFQHLRVAGHKITTGCAGMAASMAGILLQAGDVRWVGEQSWIMIHRAAFGAAGKTFEVEDEVEFVKRIEKRIIDIFVKRSHLTSAKIKRNWDRKDWWITAEEALELGLVDEVRGLMP